MGTIELDNLRKQLLIRSNIFLYGNAASEQLARQCADEIETMWNEPRGQVQLKNERYNIVFSVKGHFIPNLEPEVIFNNTNPANNYFRVEEFVKGNISFVDGLHCNTGYFKLDNLYLGSTTAAHEYGHTLGLDHPDDLDLRGQGIPGIMYPRGTLVDPAFQYNPLAAFGEPGHTMHPMHRRVSREDISQLRLHEFNFSKTGAIMIGDYSAVYHEAHREE